MVAFWLVRIATKKNTTSWSRKLLYPFSDLSVVLVIVKNCLKDQANGTQCPTTKCPPGQYFLGKLSGGDTLQRGQHFL